eukprot:2723226-Pyramimonas_sp.AAC.1
MKHADSWGGVMIPARHIDYEQTNGLARGQVCHAGRTGGTPQFRTCSLVVETGHASSARPCHGVTATMDACDDFSSREVHSGESFKGQMVPFGVRIFWKCPTPHLYPSAGKFGETTREVLFMGYRRSGGRWSGDYL